MTITQTVGVAPAYRVTAAVAPTVCADYTHMDLEISVLLQRVGDAEERPPPEPTTIETKLFVADGAPYVLSCSGPHDDATGGERPYLEYLTVTATLVTPFGEPKRRGRTGVGQPRDVDTTHDGP